jgi:hypothetical protein
MELIGEHSKMSLPAIKPRPGVMIMTNRRPVLTDHVDWLVLICSLRVASQSAVQNVVILLVDITREINSRLMCAATFSVVG